MFVRPFIRRYIGIRDWAMCVAVRELCVWRRCEGCARPVVRGVCDTRCEGCVTPIAKGMCGPLWGVCVARCEEYVGNRCEGCVWLSLRGACVCKRRGVFDRHRRVSPRRRCRRSTLSGELSLCQPARLVHVSLSARLQPHRPIQLPR